MLLFHQTWLNVHWHKVWTFITINIQNIYALRISKWVCSENYGGPGDGIFMPSDKTLKKNFFSPLLLNILLPCLFYSVMFLFSQFSSTNPVWFKVGELSQDIWIYLMNWTNMDTIRIHIITKKTKLRLVSCFEHYPITRSDSKLAVFLTTVAVQWFI